MYVYIYIYMWICYIFKKTLKIALWFRLPPRLIRTYIYIYFLAPVLQYCEVCFLTGSDVARTEEIVLLDSSLSLFFVSPLLQYFGLLQRSAF